MIGTYRWANNLLNYEFIVPDSLAMRTEAYETAKVISYLLESTYFLNLFLSAFLFCFRYRYVHQEDFTQPFTSYFLVCFYYHSVQLKCLIKNTCKMITSTSPYTNAQDVPVDAMKEYELQEV